MCQVSCRPEPSQPATLRPAAAAMRSRVARTTSRSVPSASLFRRRTFDWLCPMNSQPSFFASSMISGCASHTSLFSATVPRTPWRAITSIRRQMPTRLP